MPSVFPHTKGTQKKIARLKIINAIKKTDNKVGEMLSLPAGKAVMEKLIHKDIKTIRFNICEHSKPIFQELANTVCNYFVKKPKLHLCKIGDLIYKAKENQYLHIVLDYCGAVSTFEEEIKVAFEKNIVKVGGIISLTLSKRGCSPEFVKKISNLSGTKFSEKESATRDFLNNQAKDKYVKEVDYMYGDKTPMMLYIYRRIK